jgi:hypothetical protein
MTANVARRGRRRMPEPSPDPISLPVEAIAIGEINQTLFDCPTCDRPLPLRARRCPGCGTRLVLGVPLAKASLLATTGLAIGIAVGGVIGFGVGIGRNVQAASAPVVAALPSTAPAAGPAASHATTASVAPPSVAPSFSADPVGQMPPISRSALLQAVAVNSRLRSGEASLRTALAARSFDPSAVAEILRSMSADTVFGQQLAGRLAAWPGASALAEDLDTLYGSVHDTATEALVSSVRDAAAYRTAATAMLKALAPLPALDADAAALAGQIGLDPAASVAP